jgi:nicotinate-nucleotide--dimethylbenzimidazole phosphoribosyltransferase
MKLETLSSRISPINGKYIQEAKLRLDSLTKPQGSLGRLEEFATRLVAITEKSMPDIDRKVVFTFAGDHGIADEGVSAFPKEVTRQMVFNFLNGGAGINVLARYAGADVVVVDIGVDYDFNDLKDSPLVVKKVVKGTKNIRKGPAMTRNEALRCLEVGMELASTYAEKGYRIFGSGEMGIANTTPSSAITSLMTGRSVETVTGRGTGISDDSWRHKVQVIKDAISINHPDVSDPVDVLAKVGGAEIGGFISTAGALIAYAIEPKTKDYMFAAHNSQEVGHKAMLEKIGLSPILNLDLRLGEGTGAVLAMMIIEAGLKIYKEMATFNEAAVSEKGSGV